MAERARGDLKPNILEPLCWEPDKLASSLDTVFTHAIGEAIDAIDAIDWYLRSKRRKKRWALFFRVVAIVAGSIAGILPMLSQVLLDASKQPVIQPVWASISLAIAVALVALDHFFGFSSGWMRYTAAELHIRQLLRAFQMDWEMQKVSWKASLPDADQLQVMLTRAREFEIQVSTIVCEETSHWIQEFQGTLKQLEKPLSSQAHH